MNKHVINLFITPRWPVMLTDTNFIFITKRTNRFVNIFPPLVSVTNLRTT
ncbi:alkyl sulfatase [Listeria monocytogenes]|nr:alkyl sulfatase [Listeria monocytogenes]